MKKFLLFQIALLVVIAAPIATWICLDKFVGKRSVELPPISVPEQPVDEAQPEKVPHPELEQPSLPPSDPRLDVPLPPDPRMPPEIEIPRTEPCPSCPNGCPTGEPGCCPEGGVCPVQKTPIWQQPELFSKPAPKPEVKQPVPKPKVEAPPLLKRSPVTQVRWTKYKGVRSRSIPGAGTGLSDIDNHMDYSKVPAEWNGTYRSSDKINWAHETTHGIQGVLRNIVGYKNNANCFYCLGNYVAIIREPRHITIATARRYVPSSLHRFAFDTMTSTIWPENPLYVFDEWVAYTNGTFVRVELDSNPRLSRDRSIGGSVEGMISHTFYALSLTMAVKANDRENRYDDKQLKAFTMWNTERTIKLLRCCRDGEGQKAAGILRAFQVNADCRDLRTFCKAYYGNAWCKKVLGI